MITLSILVIVLLVLAVVASLIALVCGSAFLLVFGDLIIAALIIGLIIKLFRRKK